MGSAFVDRDWSKLRRWLIKKRLEGKTVTKNKDATAVITSPNLKLSPP
jgi:hypothetical protein